MIFPSIQARIGSCKFLKYESKNKQENFLEYVPVTNFKWRISEETHRVIVERPKFDNAILKKYSDIYKDEFLVSSTKYHRFTESASYRELWCLAVPNHHITFSNILGNMTHL